MTLWQIAQISRQIAQIAQMPRQAKVVMVVVVTLGCLWRRCRWIRVAHRPAGAQPHAAADGAARRAIAVAKGAYAAYAAAAAAAGPDGSDVVGDVVDGGNQRLGVARGGGSRSGELLGGAHGKRKDLAVAWR